MVSVQGAFSSLRYRERLADNIRYTKKQLQKLNEKQSAPHRQGTQRDGWKKALPILKHMEIANEVQKWITLPASATGSKLARWLTAAALTDTFAFT